jgi:RNA polymerase sigma-70 factor (ECF subfamily)
VAAADDPQALETLLRRVGARDARALRELFDATSSRLLAIAVRVLEDRSAAEDVLQEAYLALWNRASAPPEPCRQPLAWMTTLVRNRAIDVARRRRPEVPLQWTGEDGEEHGYDVADDSAGPPEQIQAVQEDARLGQCLERIEPEPRHALMLAYYEGLTHQEVAARLARPLGTVKAWVRRSLISLQGCLGAA